MARKFTIFTKFDVQDGMSSKMGKIGGNVKRFTKGASSGFGVVKRQIGSAIAMVGGLAVVTDFFRKSATLGKQFQQTVTNAAAKFGSELSASGKITQKVFNSLSASAKKVGAETEFSANQAAKGLEFLALAGFNSKQSIVALPKIVDLATAAQIDLGRASDIATDSLGAFGLMSKNTGKLTKNLNRVMDVFAATTTSANTDIEAMFEAIKQAGAVANTAGVSIEQFSAITGTMANAGIKGSQAGTALKNIFLRLARPPKEAAKELKKLGIVTRDASGNMRNIFDILGDVEKATKKMGTAQKAASLDLIFSKRAVAGVASIMKVGVSEVRKFSKQLEKSGGAAKQMAANMRNTLQGSVKTLQSSFESLQLTLFDTFKGALGEGVRNLTRIVRNITLFIKTNAKLVKSSKAFKLLVKIIKSIKGIFTFIAKEFVKLNKEFKAGKFILDLLTGAFKVLSTTINIIAGFVRAFMTGFRAVMRFLKPVLPVIKELAKIILILVAAKKALTVVIWAVNAAMTANPIAAIIVGVTTLIGGIVLLVQNFDKVKKVVGDFFTAAIARFKEFGKFVGGIAMVIVKAIGGAFKKVWNGIMSFFIWLKKGFDSVVGAIKKKLEPLIKIVKGITKTVGGITGKVGEFFGFKKEKITEKLASPELLKFIEEKKTPLSPQTSTITRNNNANVNVNFNNPPAGTEIKQDQEIPGFSLNLGTRGAF